MSAGFGWIDLTPHTKVAGFVEQLREGRLVGSKCMSCGAESFPPRADCPNCLEDEFELRETDRRGTVVTFTQIAAAPAGFEELAPYTIGVVDLRGGGRALAWFAAGIPSEEIEIGMEVVVQPRVLEREGQERFVYLLERP